MRPRSNGLRRSGGFPRKSSANSGSSQGMPWISLRKDLAMFREILFVDPSVCDLDTILGSLRQDVEAIVLDPVRAPARQIAAALAEREHLDDVHVIAHGAPGRVSFAAGESAAAALADEAADLAAIGAAPRAGGDPRR